MEKKEKRIFLEKRILSSAKKKIAALVLASAMVLLFGGEALAFGGVFPAVVENIPSANIRIEGGRKIAEQKGFCVVLFDVEKGIKTEINLVHNEGEKPGECIVSDKGIFMKYDNMCLEKIAGEWKLFGGRIYDFSGRPIMEIPGRGNKSTETKNLSASFLPLEEGKIEDLRVRWLGENTLVITNGERLFYYSIESGTLTEKDFANRKTENI